MTDHARALHADARLTADFRSLTDPRRLNAATMMLA
jgi:hypothetical protein